MNNHRERQTEIRSDLSGPAKEIVRERREREAAEADRETYLSPHDRARIWRAFTSMPYLPSAAPALKRDGLTVDEIVESLTLLADFLRTHGQEDRETEARLHEYQRLISGGRALLRAFMEPAPSETEPST